MLEYQADCFKVHFSFKYLHPDQINYTSDEGGKNPVRESPLENEQVSAPFSHIGINWSFPGGWSHMCNSISMCGPPPRSQRGEGVQPGAARNHICLDKNRSMPRNRIQKQREIPNKVVQYADHTATEAASLFASPNTGVNVARLSDTFLGRL